MRALNETEKIEALVLWLSTLTDQDREAVFDTLRRHFCLTCGTHTPRCYCLSED
jgi:hypothetical protein